MTQTVVYYSDSATFGGMERSMLQLMQGLDRHLWRPILMHHPEPGLSVFLRETANLDVRLVETPRLPLGLPGAMHLLGFRKSLHLEDPAVFHAHLSWPLACKWSLVAALFDHIPAVVATLHLWVETPYSISARWQQRLIAMRLGRYITVSQDIARRVGHTFNVPPSKLQVIHSAVDIDRFTLSTRLIPPPELEAYQNRPVILTVARLDQQKDHSTLLKAAARLPQAIFVIIGDGPERSSLEALRQQLGITDRVIFAGFREDIPAWLAASTLFVLPSFYEGVPLSLLEAMAAGIPVITSAIPGIDEAVTHAETGWLVPPGDTNALVNAIQTLLSDPELAARLASNGQARVQREFSTETMIGQIMRVYSELVENSRSGANGE